MITPPDHQTFKSQVQASFNATPAHYGTNGDYHWKFAERLVSNAPSLHPGQIVLDVATGTAPVAIMVADHVKPEGSVIASDLSPGILARAVQNIAAVGLTNVHLLVSDAEAMSIADGLIDAVFCSSSIVWFPDILRALREWHRILRPNGWVAFSCFGGPARQTTQRLLLQLLEPYGIWFPELNSPLNTLEKCRAMVQVAGFQAPTVIIAQEQQFTTDPQASFEQAWAAGGRFHIHLPADDLAHVKSLYCEQFNHLLESGASWNHDYEQFIVAVKGAD